MRNHSEDNEQIALLRWAAMQSGKYPELKLLYHIPNGGRRSKSEAARFKAMNEEQEERERQILAAQQETMMQAKIQAYKEAIRSNVLQSNEAIDPIDLIVIDTETTGLSPICDEIFQVSIIDGTRNVLYDSYIKPVAEMWDEAERVNGITHDMVANAPSAEIEVRCHNATEEQLNDIYKIVCENTHNISVTLGKFTTAKGSEDPEIFNPSSGEWVDADMVEFVLIKGYATVNS